jgi:hypothetical protein
LSEASSTSSLWPRYLAYPDWRRPCVSNVEIAQSPHYSALLQRVGSQNPRPASKSPILRSARRPLAPHGARRLEGRAARPAPGCPRERAGLQPGAPACAARWTRRSVDPGRGYFPRAVFFFGFGFVVLPVLSGAGSFFGLFGDTGSLLAWLAVFGCLRARVRLEAPLWPGGRSGRRYSSASPACQSTERSCPRPETAIVNGCCRRARPAKVARRCVPASLSRATAASRLSQQTTCQERGSVSADQATPS